MPAFVDISGQTFGRWLALRRDVSVNKAGTRFVCRCECGTERSVLSNSLTRGLSVDCGCGRVATLRERNYKHGLTATRAHECWSHMKARCLNPRNKDFAQYGGRGISVCDEWKDDFTRFLADMGEPGPGLTLDRIDVNGCYHKENCRWATRAEQTANRRPFVQNYTRGECSGQSKLTDAAVAKIRTLAQTRSQTEIGAEFGVSQSLVSQVIRRQIWKHIP